MNLLNAPMCLLPSWMLWGSEQKYSLLIIYNQEQNTENKDTQMTVVFFLFQLYWGLSDIENCKLLKCTLWLFNIHLHCEKIHYDFLTVKGSMIYFNLNVSLNESKCSRTSLFPSVYLPCKEASAGDLVFKVWSVSSSISISLDHVRSTSSGTHPDLLSSKHGGRGPPICFHRPSRWDDPCLNLSTTKQSTVPVLSPPSLSHCDID